MDWKTTWWLIKSDIIRRTVTNGKDLKFKNIVVSTLSPPAIPIILFRLQHYFYCKNFYFLCKIISQINIIFFSVEIGSGCQADEGLLLGHASGIVIFDQVKIGKNCTIMPQSSISAQYEEGKPHKGRYTVLGDDILVGSGARIVGPGVIGTGSRIAMNCVAKGSYPENSIIAGVPGKVLRTRKDNETYTPEVANREYKFITPLSFAETWRRIRQDLENRAHIDGNHFSKLYYLKLFFSPPALAVFIFRWASYFERASFRVMARLLTTINIIVFKTEIGTKAEIEGGFVLVHANGVLINNQVKIGKNAVFSHHNSVAIGPRSNLDPVNDRVIIGDHFMAEGGSRILGNIKLGNNVIVTMNALVTRSHPDGAVLAGIPAKNLKKFPSKNKIISKQAPSPPDGKVPTFSETINIIKKDIIYRAENENKKANCFYCLKIVMNPPAMAVVFFRFAHYFEKKRFHPLAKILSVINNVVYSVEIHPLATIGPGLILSHANGILIHEKSIIGKNCIFTLQNSVSIGPGDGLDPVNGRVVIGDHAFIGMGARIIGNIRLGNNITIDANAVVTESAPDDSILVGIPAKPTVVK